MPKTLAVVVSDVHIGTGGPTVWYQPAVHERYLATIFDWVCDHADDVRELILLGDIFDFWTYPPNERPPTLADVIEANPAILGPSGRLAGAVRALDGGVTYLLGNHDATVSAPDMEVLRSSVGPVRLSPPVHVLAGVASGRRTVFAHGHTWTMFNAPEPESPWEALPIGHFVTRAVAHQMATELGPGQTVADVPNQGAPNGLDLRRFLRSVQPRLGPSLARLLLDYVAHLAGLDDDEPILMTDGEVATMAMAKDAYANLFRRWVAKEGGLVDASRAALADQYGDYLAWFAQRLALETGSDLAVFGHTHYPVGGLTVSPVDYVNSGFACPSVPDMPAKEPTFVVVDLESATAEVRQVVADGGGTHSIRPYAARRIPPVPSPAVDYSCYVAIENHTSQALVMAGSLPVPAAGRWVVPPPAEIRAGEVGRAWLQDKLGVAGSGGRCSYTTVAPGGPLYDFAFRCPTGPAANRAAISGAGAFRVRVGGGDWQADGVVPRSGHPLEVRFEVG
jgi:UDP-2,3-diacylglucosamine pyrophosphatase LpxH